MNDVRPSRRQLLAGLSALALAPALVACGDDSGSASDTRRPARRRVSRVRSR